MKLGLCLASLLSLLLVGAPLAQDERAPTGVEPAALGDAINVHRSGALWFSGQFSATDVPHLKSAGIRRVITLRKDGEVSWDEAGAVTAAGLAFESLPFSAPESLSDEVFDRLRVLLAEDAGPTLLHCGSANRVGGAWLPYRVLDQGVPVDVALAEAAEIGLAFEPYRERALDYIARRQAEDRANDPPREPSVKPGINEPYLAPDLDVGTWIARFEVESREVFAERFAVRDALALTPGMRMADIGSGTGLYTFLFTDAVGPAGWVYAVDIAPGFLQHVLRTAAERQTANVTGVLCPESSIGLPPASIDLAWVCDTYHHFEYPKSTLASIHRALVPGGRLVVLDFERVPGVTREWLLDHVRADKQVFRAEIEAAGFAFVRELEVPGLVENYMLEFRKPASTAGTDEG